MTRWHQEANDLGYTARTVLDAVRDAAREAGVDRSVTVAEVVDLLSAGGSTWSRADVVRTICDLAPADAVSPAEWADAVVHAADQILEGCVNLDPDQPEVRRRAADGRSVRIEPTASQYTSDLILAEEEHILTWAIDRQTDHPDPSPTLDVDGLDVMQAAAARAVAGHDRLVLVEGPAGTGKTTMLRAAVNALSDEGRPVFGVAPTARAARVLETETRMQSDTIAKLLHEHLRTNRPPLPRYQLPTGTTLIVDEAGMIGTSTLNQLAALADSHGWRVALVGDPYQLQAVGRGGMFTELCATGRVHPLTTIHRFTNGWEAAASLRLRHGDPTVLDLYEEHERITPGSLNSHLNRLAGDWIDHHRHGRSVAITTATNAHVDHINAAIQTARLAAGDLHPHGGIPIAGGETAHAGDLVVTRRHDRTLTTTTGDTVRNRDRWTVTRTHPDQTITVTPKGGHGAIRLPADYIREHVRLGYAATEHGNQGATVDIAYQLIDTATTSRGLYVGATRGRQGNQFLVITDTNEPGDARDLLDQIITYDRADLPATTQRRNLAATQADAPTRPAPVERFVDPPDWLDQWRQDLTRERDATVERFEQRDERRNQARHDLEDLQPALAAAREAWRPFQDRIDELERLLARELRPSMHAADDRARVAGVGRRHHARQGATKATDAVRGAQADISTIRDRGRKIRHRLDQMRAVESDLRQRAAPSTVLEMYDQQNLDRFDRILDAVDTWTAWNNGQPVNVDALTRTIATLTDPRLRGRLPGRTGDIVHPLADWLNERGIDIPTQQAEVERDLGISR